jgi:hypothetical protein
MNGDKGRNWGSQMSEIKALPEREVINDQGVDEEEHFGKADTLGPAIYNLIYNHDQRAHHNHKGKSLSHFPMMMIIIIITARANYLMASRQMSSPPISSLGRDRPRRDCW